MSVLTDAWIAIGRADDVPLYEGRRVTVDGHRIAVFRTEDGLHAVAADCPHAGGPLQDGLVAGGCVTCPLHGRRFDLRSGERVGGGPGEACDDEALATYDVAERDGVLLLRIAPGEPARA